MPKKGSSEKRAERREQREESRERGAEEVLEATFSLGGPAAQQDAGETRVVTLCVSMCNCSLY
jgi:hypothetical protein